MNQRLAVALAGKRVLVTGATGFVGEALLEKMLSNLPETTAVLLVRARGMETADQRVDALLSKPAFGGLRERLGDEGMAELRRDRITVLEGDLDTIPELPGDLDVVIHCAGEVSFDPAIDEGFTTNVFGTLGLIDAVRRSGSVPHYVHVSTAYVAGRRDGHVPEGRLDHDIDWRAEAAAAGEMRARVEADSRTPERLDEFHRAATKTHASSGPLSIARDAETRRIQWVQDRLVTAGRERARSLGWTDCYTFTKAMAERAVEELAGIDMPVSITRPSIIESALERPFPGWIEGFKMAEPIILAYGRGDLPDFPGTPDGTIDIIPVDLVVNAILTAAAQPPPLGEPAYFTICSARNPLLFSNLYQIVSKHFRELPVEQHGLGAVRIPEWTWPSEARAARLLRIGERAHSLADRAVESMPRSARTRSWGRTLDRQKRRLEFFRRYLDLYRPYMAGQLIFNDTSTFNLHKSLHPDDVEVFGFDPMVIDWPHYLGEVHVPAVTEPLRAFAAGSQPRVEPRWRAPVATPAASSIVAVFDMDGTLLPSNVVTSYLALRLPELDGAGRVRELASVAGSLPSWLAAERRDRATFLRSVYRRYAGASLAELERAVDDDITSSMLSRLSAGAVRAVRSHRMAGHHCVLVTGAIRPLTRPIAALFDEVIAADLEVDDAGRCTGHLVRPPLAGEARAGWLRQRAIEADWDLAASYAYADSATDIPLLQAVGHAVAVDPDVVLSRAARRNRWAVEIWAGSSAAAAPAVTASAPTSGSMSSEAAQ